MAFPIREKKAGDQVAADDEEDFDAQKPAGIQETPA